MLDLLKTTGRPCERPSRRHGANPPGGLASCTVSASSAWDSSWMRSWIDIGDPEYPGLDDFTADLARLKDVCRWTSGSWELGPEHYRRWNDLQNTPRDIQLLTNFLLFEYKTRVWSQGRSAATIRDRMDLLSSSRIPDGPKLRRRKSGLNSGLARSIPSRFSGCSTHMLGELP